MSTREIAVSVLASLDEQKMREFITLFADEETLTRMECDALAKDPNAETFDSFAQCRAELERES